MRVLLDTHALIWWLDDDPRLTEVARAHIADEKTTVCVSSASAWEMATKVRIGKLRDPENAVPRLVSILRERGMVELPVTVAHAVEAGLLKGEHRDPFDRMLVAQSRIERMAVITSDSVFSDYGVKVIW
ncbi:MAG: type II toxin-antitoxin system VapC family toxin [Gemmatimonadaceae bacterium]